MKSKILFVDDEEPIRELVRFYIEKEGFTMLEAGNGVEALEVFEMIMLTQLLSMS